MAELKFARSYVATAVKDHAKRCWYAQWAAPGLIPALVMDGDYPQIFNTPGSAEEAARRVLFSALNATRVRNTVTGREMMTGEEFAVAMKEAGLTVRDTGLIFGTREDRVLEMIRGLRNPPFTAWWGMEMFREEPGLKEWAAEIAAKHTNLEREED